MTYSNFGFEPGRTAGIEVFARMPAWLPRMAISMRNCLMTVAFALAVCMLFADYATGQHNNAISGADVVAEAEALIQRRDYVDAYNLLGPLMQTDAIDYRAAFLFGIASFHIAKDAPGLASEGREALFRDSALAFNYVLASFPQDMGVRLFLARSLFHMGQLDTAKTLFEQVLAADPPDEIKGDILNYLNVIAEHTD